MWSVYDKEINVLCSEQLTDSELVEFIQYIAENEADRAAFYEFENDSGEILDCWDVCRRFALEIEFF